MHLKARIAKMEDTMEPSFNEAIEWVEARNPIIAVVIKREFGKLKKTGTVEIRTDMTLEEATKIYLDNLK